MPNEKGPCPRCGDTDLTTKDNCPLDLGCPHKHPEGYRAADGPTDTDLLDVGYAPGDYMSKCVDCGSTSWDADKRAIRCRPCAVIAWNRRQAAPDKCEAAEGLSEETLLPCPLCNGPAYLSDTVNGSSMRYVGCSACGISMKAAWVCAAHPGKFCWSRDLIAAWNRRPSTPDEREAIARIIDPEAFVPANYSNQPERARLRFQQRDLAQQAVALAKADAILARRPSTPSAGVEEVDSLRPSASQPGSPSHRTDGDGECSKADLFASMVARVINGGVEQGLLTSSFREPPEDARVKAAAIAKVAPWYFSPPEPSDALICPYPLTYDAGRCCGSADACLWGSPRALDIAASPLPPVTQAAESGAEAGLALVTTTCFECGHDLEGPWCPACNPPSGWRDIASAPLNGTPILLWYPGLPTNEIQCGQWRCWNGGYGEWIDSETGDAIETVGGPVDPTHWMPRPSAPAVPATSIGGSQRESPEGAEPLPASLNRSRNDG